MTHFPTAWLAACALIVCGAQASPLLADCWTEDRHNYADDELIPAAEKGGLAADVAAIGSKLKGDKRLGALNGYRLQLNSFIGFSVGDGSGPNYAEVWVGVHGKDVWQSGCAINQEAADVAPDANVRISINDMGSLQSVADAPDDTPLAPFPAPEPTSESHGRAVYNDRMIVVIPKGTQLLMPYLVRDHIAEWKVRLADLIEAGAGDYMEAELKALNAHDKQNGANQGDKQTAFTPDMKPEGAMWAYGLASDENARPRVYLNPMLRQGTAMTSHFMIVDIEIYDENPALRQALEVWLRDTDFSFLEARLK